MFLIFVTLQVLTPRSIESLQDIWSHLSLYLDLSFHSSLFGSESLVALSLRINSFDSHHKPIFLQAITEAFKSPRPKYRHGAVLVKSVDEVIAVSRNESIKESKQLQRIRHAEIGCLIQVGVGLISISLNEFNSIRLLIIKDNFHVYIK